MIRLIQKWLATGIIEETDWSGTGNGTPRGSVISPILANVFLHYVFDLWINQWRKRHCRGQCIVVRYADDFVIGFEHESESRACLDALKERLQKFGLELHPEKTRLLEFGRRASDRRDREGREPCETFEFLGLTHSCGKTRKNKRFVLLRRTSRKRLIRTLAAIKVKLLRRRHDRVGATGRWLASVLRGWLGCHAVPDNYTRLDQFVTEVTKLWLHQLRRRSQKGRAAWPWERMNRLVDRFGWKSDKGRGDQLRGPCPLPACQSKVSNDCSKRKDRSFSIHASKNIYRCFRCGSAGNALDFWQVYRATTLMKRQKS